MKPTATPLLATKFYTPPPSPNLVHRPRLLELLDSGLSQPNGFSRKLTLVSAPAGYGKTTLVAEWLYRWGLAQADRVAGKDQKTSVAWLSLDEEDNDPALFLSYLIAALKRVDEHIGGASLSILQSPQPLPAQIFLTTLINELAAITHPICLVLDDYHVIHTSPIHQHLTFLLDHLPPQLHLVILTREDPLLPLAQLRARGQVLEVRQDDLRFTAAESADFLQRVKGIPLTLDQVAALERQTEGWIAGLQLAALSMQGHADLPGFIQAFTGSSRFILDYLIEEVFKRQPAEVQDFLLKTSLLERLSAPLCDALVERSDSQQLLEALEQANLFIVPLDLHRAWYRYHRLFAELLRHRLRVNRPELESKLHQRASRWFQDQGLLAEAIHHALAAQDWERAASLIHNNETDYLKRGEVMTVIGWFQALPEAYLSANPKLYFDYCWPLLLASHYDLAAPLLERLEGIAQNMPAFLGEIYAAQAYLARGLGDNARMVERSQWALERLPQSSLNSRSIVAMNLGLAYWHQGKMGEAEKTLSEAMEAARLVGNHYAALTSLIFLGRVYAVRGQLHQAEEYSKRAIQMGNEIPINTLAHMDLATLHYEWNQLERSQEHLQKAIVLCQRMQNDEFLAACWLLASRLHIALGDMSGAGEALEQAWALARTGKIPETMVNRLHSAQVRWLVHNGQSPGDWALKLTDQIDCHPFYRFLGVTKALTLPHAQARAYLERLAQVAQTRDWGYGLVAVRALQASVAQTPEEGLDHLCKALRLAESGGFIRSFVEAGERIIPLLRQAAGRGVYPDTVARILAVMTSSSELSGKGFSTLVEPLSDRELQVLRLIVAGMSNREIAAELIISPGTAKTHVHNLCGKLGVRNRTEAAMRAKEMGLV
jgi:LuxR family maltose regulon positive regulatory protein